MIYIKEKIMSKEVQEYLNSSTQFELLMNIIADDYDVDYAELSELSVNALSQVIYNMKGNN